MGVGFVVGGVAHEVGSPDFLNGFFATISHYLEPNGWGTEYPELMIHLYQGALGASKAQKVLRDLQAIREQLKGIKPAKIIWDIDDLDAKPPWGNDDGDQDTNLSDSFITSDGRNLFDVLAECLQLLTEQGEVLTIEPY
jgi:hypothetical protein